MPEAAKMLGDDSQIDEYGGNYYISTLFCLLFMLESETRPESFGDIDDFMRSNANSQEAGDMLALPFTHYGYPKSFYENYFVALMDSVNQKENAEQVAKAIKSIHEDFSEEDWGELDISEVNIDEYGELFVTDNGIKSVVSNQLDSSLAWLDHNRITADERRFYSAYALVYKLLEHDKGGRAACFGPNMTNSFGNADVGYCDDWKLIAANQVRSLLGAENGMEYICARPLDVIGNEKFDWIAWDFPLGFRTSALEGESDALLRCKQGLPEYGRALSADWTYARLAMESLNKGGRAVLQVSDGALMNGADARIRKHFLNNGWVEGVIKLKDDGPIRKSLLVLSYGNAGVRFVDDSLATSGDDDDSDFDVRKAYESWESGDTFTLYQHCADPDSDGGWSLFGERRAIYIPNEKIDQDSLLNVSRYLQADLLLENPVMLADVAESIGRGTSMAAWEILEMTSDEESKVKYLALSDIADGRASGRLVNIWEDMLEEKEEKHCARNGDVLLSRNEPMTVMVVEVPDDEMLLVNGNTYIIRFDHEYMNPYYAAAFLSSRLGQEVVRRLCVGTKLKTLPRKMLKKIQIPMLPLGDQVRIATEYQARLDEIQVLHLRAERVREEILMAFNEGR